MFNFTISRTSDAIRSISCNVLAGFALVSYKNGSTYTYTNVSKRAMLNLYFNRNMSLGFWVNDNLKENARVSYERAYRFAYNQTFA
jgi:hypothetical protein